MLDYLVGAFSISTKFRNVTDNFEWLYTTVYGASDSGYYNQCWQELRDIRLLFDDPWLIEGDFNSTLCANERNFPGGDTSNRRYFKAFVNKLLFKIFPWQEEYLRGPIHKSHRS